MDSVIYYFSATGNSLKVAKDVAYGLENTKLIKICTDNMYLAKENFYPKVGIVSPVYYYGLPLMVKEFVTNLKLDENSYVYTVATCGGSVGASIKQLKSILGKKGVKLSSAFTIVMPDNYQVMYSPPPQEKQKRLFELESKNIKSIIEIIKKSQSSPYEEKNSIASKLLGGVLSGTFRPNSKDKNFWVDEKCNGCGICSKVCPSNNITFTENKPQWLHKCEHCLACMHWCPKQSIQYKKGTIKRERYHHPGIKVSELFNNTEK